MSDAELSNASEADITEPPRRPSPLDGRQLDELRRWGQGLLQDERPEVRASASAILLLAGDLEAARSQLLEERMLREALEARLLADNRRQPLVQGLFARFVGRDRRGLTPMSER